MAEIINPRSTIVDMLARLQALVRWKLFLYPSRGFCVR
ncbi:hypothetical protein QF001_000392 [Paraburkholderia youngii]